MIAILPSDLDKLLWVRLGVKGEVPEEDWLNNTVKVMVTWFDHLITEIYVQHFASGKKQVTILRITSIFEWVFNIPKLL